MTVLFDERPVGNWEMKLYSWAISMPEPKTSYISVPGRDGDLDFTQSLDGTVRYNNRSVSLALSLNGDYEKWFTTIQDFSAFLHGRKLKLIFSDDPNHYYLGRFTIDPIKDNQVIGDISVSGICDPYKYKTEKTVVESDVAGSTQVILTNEGMPAVPKITADAQMQLVFTLDGTEHTVTVGAGTQLAPDLLLQAGTYEITVNGTGHVKFEYQEGAL